jgi:hypothetical protein
MLDVVYWNSCTTAGMLTKNWSTGSNLSTSASLSTRNVEVKISAVTSPETKCLIDVTAFDVQNSNSFPPISLRFPKEHCFWKVPRLRPCVLLTKATCRWRWLWSNCGIILTGEDWKIGTKDVPVPFCPPQIPHGLAWDRSLICSIQYSKIQFLLTENIAVWAQKID